MGQASGMSGGQLGMNLLKGGLTGLSQGLQNYGSNRPQQFNFSQLQQGFQAQKKPLGQGITPGAAQSPPLNSIGWGGYNGG